MIWTAILTGILAFASPTWADSSEGSVPLAIQATPAPSLERAYAAELVLVRPLAELGHAEAQFTLGTMYEDGHGLRLDLAEAAKWYRLAAEQGLANAQFILGVFYENAKGVPRDFIEATKWYQRAADVGLDVAQYNLGVMYDRGRGVPQAYAEAAKWYSMAADQGQPEAQFNLGLMYDKAQGVAQDDIQAHKWLNLASSRFPASEKKKIAAAIKNRDRVAARMSAAQVAEAQRRAILWTPKPR